MDARMPSGKPGILKYIKSRCEYSFLTECKASEKKNTRTRRRSWCTSAVMAGRSLSRDSLSSQLFDGNAFQQ